MFRVQVVSSCRSPFFEHTTILPFVLEPLRVTKPSSCLFLANRDYRFVQNIYWSAKPNRKTFPIIILNQSRSTKPSSGLFLANRDYRFVQNIYWRTKPIHKTFPIIILSQSRSSKPSSVLFLANRDYRFVQDIYWRTNPNLNRLVPFIFLFNLIFKTIPDVKFPKNLNRRDFRLLLIFDIALFNHEFTKK